MVAVERFQASRRCFYTAPVGLGCAEVVWRWLARVLGLDVVVRYVSRGAAEWFKEGGARISACAPNKEGRRASRAVIAVFGCECAVRGDETDSWARGISRRAAGCG